MYGDSPRANSTWVTNSDTINFGRDFQKSVFCTINLEDSSDELLVATRGLDKSVKLIMVAE